MKKTKETIEEKLYQNNIIMNALIEDYQGIIKVELDTGNVFVVKSKNTNHVKGTTMYWKDYIEDVLSLVYEDDHSFMRQLTLEKLNEYYSLHNSIFPFEVRTIAKDRVYDWNEISATIIESDKKELLITIKLTNESHMMQKIMDLYVYNNLDYLSLIDINQNSYTMYSGNTRTPIPPKHGHNYEEEVLKYNRDFLVPEELEEVTMNMTIQNVVNKLRRQEIYEFTAGFFDQDREYHRARVQFSYYDKAAGLVAMTRTDITQIYIDEGKKERKLANALREAKHDAMTGLYNNKATTELISHAILHQYRAQAVLLFIDIDNFKLVNDTLGHPIGDDVIRHLSEKLKNIANKDGVAGRIGGDEFVLFLPITNTMGQIEKYAQEICDVMSDCACLKGYDLSVSCSVGISVYPKDGTSYIELLSKSDQALYYAKGNGKSRFSFYSTLMKEYTNKINYEF